MSRTETTVVGIDVGEEGGKELDLVALNMDRVIVERAERLPVSDAARHVADLQPEMVCIDSPSDWAPAGARRRLAEEQLRQHGINAYSTPSRTAAGPFHRWMENGTKMYAAIAEFYPRYRSGDLRRTAVEYFPHATTVVLTGEVAHMRDKGAVRRRLLERNGVDQTRLRTIDQVDAALGAITGILAIEGRGMCVGDETCALLLPVTGLLSSYPRVGAALRSAKPRPTPVSRACACGCGAPGPGAFRPGHDATLKSTLLQQARAGDRIAAGELLRRHWW